MNERMTEKERVDLLIKIKKLEDAIERRVGENSFDNFVDKTYERSETEYYNLLCITYNFIIRDKHKAPKLCLDIVLSNVLQGML